MATCFLQHFLSWAIVLLFLSSAYSLLMSSSCSEATSSEVFQFSLSPRARMQSLVGGLYPFLHMPANRGAVAEWVRALDWRPGSPGFESRCGNLLASDLGNTVSPALPVSFGEDTESGRSLLSGVYTFTHRIYF